MALIEEKQTRSGWHPDLDPEGDMIGVEIDHPKICGYCLAEMKQISKGVWQCPDCGGVFKEKV